MSKPTLPDSPKRRQVRHRNRPSVRPSTYHPVMVPCEAGGCFELHTGGDSGESRFCPEHAAERGAA
jgi:hypothetical protein